jgi:hypothetical protein
MTCLYLRGCLRAPAFSSATLKTQGALAAATCFSGRKSCISTPRASMFKYLFSPFRLILLSVVFLPPFITLCPLLFTQGAVFSLFAAVVLWQQERAERKRPRSFCSLDVDGEAAVLLCAVPSGSGNCRSSGLRRRSCDEFADRWVGGVDR